MMRPPSIRFQISVLLLMSTLNAVILGTAALALFEVLADSPSGAHVAAVQGIEIRLADVQTEALETMAGGADVGDEVFEELDAVGLSLAGMGSEAGAVQMELPSYVSHLERWNVHLASGDHQAPDGAEDAAGAEIMHDLVLSNLRVTGALRRLVYYVRPPWVDALAPAAPWLGAWLLTCTVATVLLAGALRQVLSVPLAALRRAADEMATGRLDVRIPEPEGAPEVQSLARAMSDAQARLVTMIAVLDLRNRQTATMLGQLVDGVVLVDGAGRVVERNAQADVLLRQLSPKWPACDVLPDLVPELDAGRLCDDEDEHLDITRNTDGRRLVVACSVRQVPVAGPGTPRSWVVVFSDVTEARLLDTLQREFLSVVTHELKTPLVAIEGFARLLLAQKGGPLSEKQLGWVGTIREQGQVLLQMVTNLLDATRLEAGNLPIHPAIELPSAVFAEWVRTWRGVVEARGLTFTEGTDLGEDDTNVSVRVDAFRLAQVIGNLVNNALKFTPAGGEIRFRLQREGDEIVFAVQDTGRGVPPEAIPRLFDRFYQVEKGDTRVAGGAGLGLYIVKQLVSAQGGRIVVTSEVDRGSAFALHFPIFHGDSGGPVG